MMPWYIAHHMDIVLYLHICYMWYAYPYHIEVKHTMWLEWDTKLCGVCLIKPTLQLFFFKETISTSLDVTVILTPLPVKECMYIKFDSPLYYEACLKLFCLHFHVGWWEFWVHSVSQVVFQLGGPSNGKGQSGTVSGCVVMGLVLSCSHRQTVENAGSCLRCRHTERGYVTHCVSWEDW